MRLRPQPIQETTTIIGQTVFTGSNGDAENYYTPWFSANGNYATFTLEILNLTANVSVVVETQTKNSEEADKWGADANHKWTSSTYTAVGLHSFTAGKTLSAEQTTDHGLLELVRFKISVSGMDTLSFANIRMLAPSWQTH